MELKTMQECLDEAVEQIGLNHTSWNGFLTTQFLKAKSFVSTDKVVKLAMQLYALQIAEAACKAQRELCANNAFTRVEEVYNGGLDPEKLSMYDEIQVIDDDSILNAPSPNIQELIDVSLTKKY